MDFMDHIWYSCIRGDDMIIDVTGIELTPGNNGEDCKGNGKHLDKNGNLIECCCDECDYLICCTVDPGMERCKECGNADCPRCGRE